MNITIRNIPNDVIDILKTLSQREKRSLNNEILIAIERGVNKELENTFHSNRHISKDTQVKIWEKLAGTWEDDRSTQEIINDIYDSRTLGREFDL